jgi:1-acyl-sn-glycerol-3-phosphate acyltransferase
LFFTVLEALLRFFVLHLRKGRPTLYDRAQWLHETSILILRRIGITVRSEGPVPQTGLIVSNHLGYLDIPFHAALGPRIFVSKDDVRSWPLFGLLARLGGTIFVKRGIRASATEAAIEIEFALRSGIPVMLFPEGTSTDGTTLLPFHAFLFEPAVETGSPVSAAAIRYESPGTDERELCYYGDVRFAPHLLETLGRRHVSGRLRFDGRPRIYSHRKRAANDCWERVARLRLRAEYIPHSDMAEQWR